MHKTVDVGCQNTLVKKTKDCVYRVPEYIWNTRHQIVDVGCQNTSEKKDRRLCM